MNFLRKNIYNKRMTANDVKRFELLEMCKGRGMKNYRRLKKSELAKLLEKNREIKKVSFNKIKNEVL